MEAAPAVSTRQLPKWRLGTVCDYIRADLDHDLSLHMARRLRRVLGIVRRR
jgi:hypothetical protein